LCGEASSCRQRWHIGRADQVNSSWSSEWWGVLGMQLGVLYMVDMLPDILSSQSGGPSRHRCAGVSSTSFWEDFLEILANSCLFSRSSGSSPIVARRSAMESQSPWRGSRTRSHFHFYLSGPFLSNFRTPL
jgi:hypothetical protein